MSEPGKIGTACRTAAALLALIVLAGCWDRQELNDRALWLATGIDDAGEGNIKVSGQIVIPLNVQAPSSAGSGGKGDPYMVVSQTGTNLGDTLQDIQSKLPREVFFGQRRVIFLGEELAKKGLAGILDFTTRLAEASFRTDMYIMKGATANDALQMRGTLEFVSVFSALKKHEQSGGRGETTYLDFLIAAHRDGIVPTLPAAQLFVSDDMKPANYFEITGVAVLDDDLKLAGYLNVDEDRNLLWLLNKLSRIILTVDLEGGNASARFVNLRSSIKPSRNKDGSWHFEITLRGDGSLAENNTGLTVEEKAELRKLEQAFEKEAANRMAGTIRKAQETFGLDVFGFGVVVHRRHPREWPALKDRWNEEFRRATFSVRADLNLKRPGLTGKSII